MKYYQKHSEGLLIAKRAFLRLIREIADENCRQDYRNLVGSATVYTMNSGGFSGRFTSESIMILQIAAERYLVDTFAMTYNLDNRVKLKVRNMAAQHRKAVTIQQSDMHLVKYFRNALALPDGKRGPGGPGF